MVVQSEDRLDALPLSILGRDASTTLIGGVCDQLIYDAQSLGFVERLRFESLACLFGWGSSADAVDPVAYPTRR
jgi:hypothetical protein